jgi:hypothetical protein
MLRTLKTALALTMILALAACSSMTAPQAEEAEDTQVTVEYAKGDVLEPEGSGGGGSSTPDEEPTEEDTRPGNGRGRDKNK